MDHHLWCNRLSHDQRPDGTCAACERLYREYPPIGTLDYSEDSFVLGKHEEEAAEK